MRKPLTAALLLGGHLLLTFSPAAATPALASPASPAYDGHYRCMYHCDERGYGHDGYRHDGHGHDGYRYDRYRDGRDYHRDRVHHDGDCWFHDDWGWHRCGYRHRW
jgi:hypothetical protein